VQITVDQNLYKLQFFVGDNNGRIALQNLLMQMGFSRATFYYHHYTRPNVQTALLKTCGLRANNDNALARCRFNDFFGMFLLQF